MPFIVLNYEDNRVAWSPNWTGLVSSPLGEFSYLSKQSILDVRKGGRGPRLRRYHRLAVTRRSRPLVPVVLTLVAAIAIAAVAPAAASPKSADPGIFKLDHLIFIVMENRSFDSMFGTFRGADGLPKNPDGTFSTCLPDPALHHCVRPYHSRILVNLGGPHSYSASQADVNGGLMNGFVTSSLSVSRAVCTRYPFRPDCARYVGPAHQPDLMGFHTAEEIPNYWTYAHDFTLQDHMFEPVDAWTLPSHLYMLSGWSATCTDGTDYTTCQSALGTRHHIKPLPSNPPVFAWGDITWLLHKYGISWKYYVAPGTCVQAPCGTPPSGATLPAMNPLPGFDTVRADGQMGNIHIDTAFFSDLTSGQLPQVSWLIPGNTNSDHPPDNLRAGQAFVTNAINAVMASSYWSSSAIFLTWDDWGGFYDHVPPIVIDTMGYGLRVPGMVISPYAKQGYVDHQTLSFDAYLKFIEDRFMNSARLDGNPSSPGFDGWPDLRPTVREDVPQLGDLTNDFDFNQTPIAPFHLNPYPGCSDCIPPGPVPTDSVVPN
jgi:phospholipase C